MSRPPRSPKAGVIDRHLLLRAWGLLGVVSALLVTVGFFWVPWRAGWHPGAAVGPGSALHGACQVGTAFAARTDHASLRSIGVFSTRLLLGGIAFELGFAAALTYLPPLGDAFGTAPLSLPQLSILLPFPFVVWGVDEVYRWWIRRARPDGSSDSAAPPRDRGRLA